MARNYTLNNVVGTRAFRPRLTRELHSKDALGAVRDVGRRGSAQDVAGLAIGLAGVVDLDRSVAVQSVLGIDALAVSREGGECPGDLVPATEIGVKLEAIVAFWIGAVAVPEGGNDG